MWVKRAYQKRETLSDRDLGGLRADLANQILRYQEAIRGYSPKKMAQFGKPIVSRLQGKLAVVDALIATRAKSA